MFTQKGKLYAFCICLTAVLLPVSALADQLHMKNGDVISGTVTKIEGGSVFIDPSYADEFAVSLEEVASIDAEASFDFAIADGSTVNGKLALKDGEQQIITGEGTALEVEVAGLDVVPPPPPYYERVSHVDVNMTWNDGNTDSRNNLIFADTGVRLGDHRHLAALTIRRDETDGVSTKKQDLFRYEYNWMFNDPWYLGATASYERDPIKDLDHRYTLGAIVGRDIFNDDVKKMTFSLGAGYSDEELAGVSDSGAVGLWNFLYEQKFREGDLTFFHNNTLQRQFFGVDNTILRTNTGFRFSLTDVIYANVSLRYDYQTEPAEGTEDYDTTLAVGIGAEF